MSGKKCKQANKNGLICFFFRYENLMLQRNDYDGDLFATAKQRIVSSYKIITECRRKSRTLPHCK